MTQLGYYDGDYDASYLELVQFLTNHGVPGTIGCYTDSGHLYVSVDSEP